MRQRVDKRVRNRTRFLIDLLTPELLEMLKAGAERDGMGLGTWLRELGKKRRQEQETERHLHG